MLKTSKIILGLLCFFSILSCKDDDSFDNVIELETFKRFDSPQFKFQNSNVTTIKTIEDRLYYAHKTNPGYISDDLAVNQLCCSRINNLDFRQSLSKDYIATAISDLSAFLVYDVNIDRHPGLLNLNTRLNNIEGNKKINLSFNNFTRNFDINGTKMLTNIRISEPTNSTDVYIFDLEDESIFINGLPNQNPIKVEFPNNENGNLGERILKVDAFQDGWIASIPTPNIDVSPNFLISKEGAVQTFTFTEDGSYDVYLGHVFTSDGKLILRGDRNIYMSESGNVDDLSLLISLNNSFRLRLIEDRMVIWNPRFAVIYEIENYESRDPELMNFRILNDEGIEFSGLNELQVFNGKVFAATSQGLFTKSLEGFWDSAPEPEDTQGQSFLNTIEFAEN